MNYKKHYDALIESRKKYCSFAEYYEVHHIIPECLGGSSKKENLVKLTAREHYMAHWLLWKATNHNGLHLAFGAMTDNKDARRLTSKQFERARMHASLASKSRIREPHSEETKAKIKAAWEKRKLTPVTEETKAKQSAAKLGIKRGPVSEVTRNRMIEAQNNRTEEWKRNNAESVKRYHEKKRGL